MEANGEGDSGGAETGMDCAGADNELDSEAPIADRRPAHPAPAVLLGRFTKLVSYVNRGGSTWVRAQPVCGGATRAAAGGAAWDPNRGVIMCWCLLRCVGG